MSDGKDSSVADSADAKRADEISSALGGQGKTDYLPVIYLEHEENGFPVLIPLSIAVVGTGAKSGRGVRRSSRDICDCTD